MALNTRTALKALALLLAILLFPGWVELAENALHLVHDGHLAHSVQHDPEAMADHPLGNHEEVPCTPTDHHCQCCPSIPSVSPPEMVALQAVPAELDDVVLIGYDGRLVTRAIPPPVRPPIV